MINIGGGDDRIGLAKLMKIKLQTSWPTSGAMINLCFRIIKEATLIYNSKNAEEEKFLQSISQWPAQKVFSYRYGTIKTFQNIGYVTTLSSSFFMFLIISPEIETV